jgi:glycosyltransferase involved in cell wall biosynthesis
MQYFCQKVLLEQSKNLKKVITISQNAKKELIDFYNLPKNKVIVATPATDPKMFYRRSKEEIKHVKQKYGIKGDYILALSNLEPRKNLSALVDVYCRLPKKIKDSTALLLVGVSGWKTDELFDNIVERVKKGANIIRPNKYVKDEDKPAIISGAKILVYPSHYEGFGMPPLEALACGVPVISADNSSLPEVVKGVATMIDSNDREALYKSTLDNLKNIDKKTNEAIIAGPKRAKEFSWVDSAQVFLDVAKEISK